MYFSFLRIRKLRIPRFTTSELFEAYRAGTTATSTLTLSLRDMLLEQCCAWNVFLRERHIGEVQKHNMIKGGEESDFSCL